MADIITRKELAQRTGLAQRTVTEYTRPGGPLADAVSGTKIDAAHPSVRRLIAEQLGAQLDDTTPHTDPVSEIPQQYRHLADLTVSQIVRRFGSLAQYEYFLKAAKTLEEVEERRLKNSERRGEVIPREYVETHLIGYIAGITQRLLNDAPKALTRRIIAAVKADTDPGEIEKMVLKMISKDLKDARDNAQRKIRRAARAQLDE